MMYAEFLYAGGLVQLSVLPSLFLRLWKIERVLVKGSLARESEGKGPKVFLILRDLQEILTSFLEYIQHRTMQPAKP